MQKKQVSKFQTNQAHFQSQGLKVGTPFLYARKVVNNFRKGHYARIGNINITTKNLKIASQRETDLKLTSKFSKESNPFKPSPRASIPPSYIS